MSGMNRKIAISNRIYPEDNLDNVKIGVVRKRGENVSSGGKL